ncbi:DNA-directed DNA polymerase alpha catalytic subunit pol1 [Didymosphaeria variabile]|uniref:DNA polymerase n=1 Tax=Didymosphaeria variabile TaxID=1932322 RepID=A0A9W9C9C4_9PLEO|nr:DNA-directed DNA polymerase alpha catalytic subunit pol1 [Didymosphaeria variabile]KAJ4349852.1 DNA-directed DNA polymerase alpha catalytic subunit pol1 [Didymosphaeria variabile]
MSSRAAALAELRKNRAGGKTRLSSYQVAEEEQLYDEVDEEGYKKVVRDRLDQDDFIVDDNGEGYVDDGREDWEVDAATESEEDDHPMKGKAAKRKREEDEESKRKRDNGISKYFSAKAAVHAPKAKPVATAADQDFMADLLGEIDTNKSRSQPRMRPVKNESRRKTRILSPPISENRQSVSKKPTNSSDAYMPYTPPAENAYDDDPLPTIDDDVPMSDPLPSSPVAKAVERKAQPLVKVEEEEEDLMEVAQPIGRTGISSASVNMTGKRPVAKIAKPEYSTPASSSPPRPTPATIDASSWNDVTNKLNVQSSPAPAITTSVGKLKPEAVLEEDGSLRMFWIDYTEINGSLCLFGKVKDKTTGNYASCFAKVDNILRKLYFLPRETRLRRGQQTDEEVEMSDVYEEVDNLMSKHRVTMHKIKPCTKKYAFELPDIPREGDYLELLYGYDKMPLSQDLTGETFSHVFGTNTALFEQFVLGKNIMGPCWLKIDNADFKSINNASWCKLEALVTKPNNITALDNSDNVEAPPLTLMSISLRTKFNAKDNKQEILMASAMIYDNFSLTDTTPADQLPCKSFTIMRPNGDNYPAGFKLEAEKQKGTIILRKTEQDLLSYFMAMFQRHDPDVLVGHRLDDVDYSTLLNRMREKKTPGWHRIGRLRRNDWPRNMGKGGGSFFVERQLAAGRLLCDLANDLGKSLMTKCQSWSLEEMCQLVLNKRRQELDNEQALSSWATSKDGLMNYVKHCQADAFFIAAISIKVQMLPLTKVLTNLAGNSWARTLSGTRAERNEYILLHQFHNDNYICPDKQWGKGKQKEVEEAAEGEEGADAKKKDKYKGGLVFEPEKGLYDKFILVMDFNSLYPSIIQEYNICFTTVDRADISEEDDKVPEVPSQDLEPGILPKLIKTLVDRRREVKKLMKDRSATADQLATWDIKQLALKLTANSMYGCLGYTKSRFYARPLAVLTTYKGRETLRKTKDMAEEKMLRVIYGDTDSVMINTNVDNIQDALKIGNEFKKEVNDSYKLLEIDIDNVFRRILLHAKKKYAAINMVPVDGKYVEKLEVKGLDMRRREYCALSKETSTELLNFLLSGEDPETVVQKIHEYLRTLSENMRAYSIPARKYTIYTQLGKNPKDYPNGNSMPSVQVALRLMEKGKHVKAKDVMSFIITGDSSGSAESAAKNAYPVDEVLKEGSELKPDIDYYLHKQILPPVERLCAPISGTNITMLAACLGLDTSKYRVSTGSGSANTQDVEVQPLESQIPDAVRFQNCTPLFLRCRACHTTFPFRGIASCSSTTTALGHNGITCPKAECRQALTTLGIVAQLESAIRQTLASYYAGTLRCSEPDCSCTTRSMSVYGHRCLGPKGLAKDCLGKMSYVYSERDIYNQMLYFQSLFDVERLGKEANGINGVKVEGEAESREKMKVMADINRERLGTLRGVVSSWLERNGRQWVQMDRLFGFVAKRS